MTVFIRVIECGVKSLYCTYFLDAPVWRVVSYLQCNYKQDTLVRVLVSAGELRRRQRAPECLTSSSLLFYLHSNFGQRARIGELVERLARPPAASSSSSSSSTASEEQQQPHSTHARSRNASASTGAERERQQSATASETHEVDVVRTDGSTAQRSTAQHEQRFSAFTKLSEGKSPFLLRLVNYGITYSFILLGKIFSRFFCPSVFDPACNVFCPTRPAGRLPPSGTSAAQSVNIKY